MKTTINAGFLQSFMKPRVFTPTVGMTDAKYQEYKKQRDSISKIPKATKKEIAQMDDDFKNLHPKTKSERKRLIIAIMKQIADIVTE